VTCSWPEGLRQRKPGWRQARDAATPPALAGALLAALAAKGAVANLVRALAPGGIYLCVTPNRLYGPSDVSGYFYDIATGFHLREYSARELSRLFTEAGFARTHFYVSPHGWHARCAGTLGPKRAMTS